MAEVYLARDLLLDRPVALKVLFPEFAADKSFVERFRREAVAAARLNQPNIVSIYDSGRHDSAYFIVMEYVEGRTLRDIIRGEGPLLAQRAADTGADIAAALAQLRPPTGVRVDRAEVPGQEPGEPLRVGRRAAGRPPALPRGAPGRGRAGDGRAGGRSHPSRRGDARAARRRRRHPRAAEN